MSIVLGLALILTAILVPLSIDYVYPGEYGLLYNTSNKNIETENYTEGRYFVGLSSRFIRFPSTIFEMKFNQEDAIECITSNYQTINLELNFELQFNLQSKTALYYFHSRYGSNWIQILKQSIIHSIIEISANFNLIDFFEKRAEIKSAAFTEISKSVSSNTQGIIVLKSMKFININFSENLEKAIELKLIEKQNTRATQIEGQINYINKQTEGLIRIAEKEIQSINQAQLTNFENTKINVHAQCLENIFKADAEGYAGLNNDLSLSSENGVNSLLSFIYAFEGKKFSGTKIVNFPSYTVNKK